jgi:hypothetical protein
MNALPRAARWWELLALLKPFVKGAVSRVTHQDRCPIPVDGQRDNGNPVFFGKLWRHIRAALSVTMAMRFIFTLPYR